MFGKKIVIIGGLLCLAMALPAAADADDHSHHRRHHGHHRPVIVHEHGHRRPVVVHHRSPVIVHQDHYYAVPVYEDRHYVDPSLRITWDIDLFH